MSHTTPRQRGALAIFLLGITAAAHADILAGGPIYGGPGQDNAVCYLFNAGTGTVTVSSNQIIRLDGTVVTLDTDTCASLGPNKGCVIHGVVTDPQTYSCKMVISPSAADVRGAFELRSNLSVLKSIELRQRIGAQGAPYGQAIRCVIA